MKDLLVAFTSLSGKMDQIISANSSSRALQNNVSASMG